MDDSAERRFVNSFIRKNRRERLLYELTTPGKRYDGASRFCHQAEDFLDPGKIILRGDDLDRRPEFERFLKDHEEPCALLSPNAALDRQILPLRDAVLQALLCPDAVAIIGSTFAAVFGEPEKGGRGKYLLAEKP